MSTERGICIYCGRTFTAHSVFDDLCPRCYAMKYGVPEPIEEDKKGDDGEGERGAGASGILSDIFQDMDKIYSGRTDLLNVPGNGRNFS